MGEQIMGTKKVPPDYYIGFDSWVDSERAHQWFTSAQNLLSRACGSDSAHYINFSAIPGEQGLSFSPVQHGQGILKAALEDVEDGHLFDVRRLVEAEVFADLLDQSRELLGAGYQGPAAVVTGCVLEDNLLRLCARHGLSLPSRAKLDLLNAELAKAGVYNKLTQKRITAIADIRNSAAHGKWGEFGQEDVAEMIDWSPSL